MLFTLLTTIWHKEAYVSVDGNLDYVQLCPEYSIDLLCTPEYSIDLLCTQGYTEAMFGVHEYCWSKS